MLNRRAGAAPIGQRPFVSPPLGQCSPGRCTYIPGRQPDSMLCSPSRQLLPSVATSTLPSHSSVLLLLLVPVSSPSHRSGGARPLVLSFPRASARSILPSFPRFRGEFSPLHIHIGQRAHDVDQSRQNHRSDAGNTISPRDPRRRSAR